jgi:crooked neck
MEMRNKFINHARNVWERACRYLPRVEQFWYKFAYMEEILGNYLGAREIFEKWMTWNPSDNAWMSYAKFEERMGDVNRARQLLYRYIEKNNKLEAYLRVAKFENKHQNKNACRSLYESALADLGNLALDEDFFISFIKFEIRMKEFDRARVLFKFGLDHISKEKSQKINKFYVKFEKMYGTKDSVEDVIYTKRRLFYEKELEKNPMNYDVWFDYSRLEESLGDLSKSREIFERAIVNIPPISEKKYWRRYVFLWIKYAIFEELTACNIERADQVYKMALEIIPHDKFTFSKIWILYAHFQIRNKNLDLARKIFGMAIGRCPREKV